MDDPVERQLEAYNARNVEEFVRWFTDDVLVEDGLGNRVARGREELRARYRTMFDANPKLHCRLVTRIRVGAWVLDEERITGRSPGEEHVVAIYRVEEGRISHVRFLR